MFNLASNLFFVIILIDKEKETNPKIVILIEEISNQKMTQNVCVIISFCKQPGARFTKVRTNGFRSTNSLSLY